MMDGKVRSLWAVAEDNFSLMKSSLYSIIDFFKYFAGSRDFLEMPKNNVTCFICKGTCIMSIICLAMDAKTPNISGYDYHEI